MDTKAVADNKEQQETQVLNAHDRCDACGQRAWHRVVTDHASTFLFCKHHADKHRPALIAYGVKEWLDETRFLAKS